MARKRKTPEPKTTVETPVTAKENTAIQQPQSSVAPVMAPQPVNQTSTNQSAQTAVPVSSK